MSYRSLLKNKSPIFYLIARNNLHRNILTYLLIKKARVRKKYISETKQPLQNCTNYTHIKSAIIIISVSLLHNNRHI